MDENANVGVVSVLPPLPELPPQPAVSKTVERTIVDRINAEFLTEGRRRGIIPFRRNAQLIKSQKIDVCLIIWYTARAISEQLLPFIHSGIGAQGVSFDPRPPPRVFKGLHGHTRPSILVQKDSAVNPHR